jgi:predicted acetyltransferase
VLEIREPTNDEREAIAQVGGLAFNCPVDADLVSIVGRLCSFDGERVVGTAQAISFDQWFGGRRVPCAGVASVAVLPEYRGRGVAGALMRDLLDRRRRHGDAVSALYPATSPLYRQLGYEFGGLQPQFRASIADLPAARGEVRELAEGDVGELMACFSHFASMHNGPVQHADPVAWEERVLAHKGEGTHQRTVVVPGNEGLTGFATYYLDSWEGDEYRLTCKHFVAVDAAALRTLLGYFRRFENSAGELAWYGAPSTAPLGLVLGSNCFTIAPGLRRWMTRVLDVPRALEARGFANGTGELVIGVDDPVFPANAGPWRVELVDRRAHVSPAPANAGAGVPLPIGLFSAFYTGLATPADLVLLGAMEHDDPRMALLSTLFAGPVPWMADFF